MLAHVVAHGTLTNAVPRCYAPLCLSRDKGILHRVAVLRRAQIEQTLGTYKPPTSGLLRRSTSTRSAAPEADPIWGAVG